MKKFLLLIMALPLAFSSCSKDDEQSKRIELDGTVWLAKSMDTNGDGISTPEMKLTFGGTTFSLESFGTEKGTEIVEGTYRYEYPLIWLTANGETKQCTISDNNKIKSDMGNDMVIFIKQ